MKAEVAEKLRKMIPRLASDQEPEVVGTVHAIQRILKSSGLDFHDLAAELTSPADERSPIYRGSPFGYEYEPVKPKPKSKGLNGKDGFFRPWNQVVGEILERHENIPKRFGGKFLTKEQISRIEAIFRGEIPAHIHEAMLKLIDNRLQTAWEAQEAARKRKAA